MSFDATAPESCRDDRRRHLIRAAAPRLNGIDYVEVGEDARTLHVYFLNKLSEQAAAQKATNAIKKHNVRIEGGARIRGIRVVDVEPCSSGDPERDDCLKVVVDRPGDFSTYTLRLVDVDELGRPVGPLSGFDPRYASVEFSFAATCPSDLDCLPAETCPPPAESPIEISYLAKDYASFRQLALDRLALLVPDWRERHVPDMGIAVVEVLAYVGDYLSYHQDAVATEAYLDTARRRVSVCRHARLVDYDAHEGCNARVWLSIEAAADHTLAADDVFFVAGLAGRATPAGLLSLETLERFELGQYEVFEPVKFQGSDGVIRLFKDHNAFAFHTWGNQECCLPRGATRATLKDPWRSEPMPDAAESQAEQGAKGYPPPPPPPPPAERPRLRAGDVLLFVESRGPRTGNAADADPTHRHAVRLIHVEYRDDPAVADPDNPDRSQPVIEIEWGPEDALPFPLCLSAVAGPTCELTEVSVAWGNVVLADHGRTIEDEELGTVPGETKALPCTCPGSRGDIVLEDGGFNPALGVSPLTFAVSLPAPGPGLLASAAALVSASLDPRGATPSVRVWNLPPAPWTVAPLFSADVFRTPGRFLEFVDWLQKPGEASSYARSLLEPETLERLSRVRDDLSTVSQAIRAMREELLQSWAARPDLLESDGTDAHFAVEVNDDSIARLRFGDGELGRRPRAGMGFVATYRVGNGPAGNVGPGSIAHIVLRRTTVSGTTLVPRNPLPAVGGTASEPVADVRLLAPHAFRAQLERGITAEDYAQLAARHVEVQRAAAEVRWTGSRQLVVVAIDQRGQAEASDAVLVDIERRLARYRRIGHDVIVTRARYVPLDIAMVVEVDAEFVAGHVKAALLDRFSSHILIGGRRGFFHPDEFSFGDAVHVSRLVAAALEIAGVQHVCVTGLRRRFEKARGELEQGVLKIGPLEIARLDSDRNFPEHGLFTLDMRGGR